MMGKAIVAVCYDQRQKSILDLVLPSWRLYAERHGLPLHIIEKSYAGPHFYWNKHVLFTVPELQSYDWLLFLDNDILVNEEAPSLLANPSPDRIGGAFESTQGEWSPESIRHYYKAYGIEVSETDGRELGIVNSGVMVIPRALAGFQENVFKEWKAGLSSLKQRVNPRQASFACEADQPHMSYALQKAERFLNIGEAFNTLWWDWYRRNVAPNRRSFLLRAKAASLLRSKMSAALWRKIFAREISTFAKARHESHFLHVAGSKSAIFLAETPAR